MTLLQTSIAKRITTDMNRGDMAFDAAFAQDGMLLSNYWRPDRTYLATMSKDALESLGNQILPPRLSAKLTGSKSDMVETLGQIIDDAHDGGMRLGEDERLTLTSWAPQSLGGSGSEDGTMFGAEAAANDTETTDEAGEALFAA